MKISKKKDENGYSFFIEFRLDANEAKAVEHCWPDLTFHLKNGKHWRVIPNPGYGGAVLVDGNHRFGGKFIDGVWKGIVYPNGTGSEIVKNIDYSIDEAINVLSDSVKKPLTAVLECSDSFIKFKNQV